MSVSDWDMGATRSAPVYGKVERPDVLKKESPNEHIYNDVVESANVPSTKIDDSTSTDYINSPIEGKTSHDFISNISVDITATNPIYSSGSLVQNHRNIESQQSDQLFSDQSIYETIKSPVDWLHEAGLEKYIDEFNRIDCMDVTLFSMITDTQLKEDLAMSVGDIARFKKRLHADLKKATVL